MRYVIFLFLLVALFTSCHNGSRDRTTGKPNENKSVPYLRKEIVDANFGDFIEKFSTDSEFQLYRTKFPLKIKRYDIDKDKDTILFIEKADLEMMDFRKTKSKDKYNQWEQKIVVDKNDAAARIKIRGIENGIMVDYHFEKKKGVWMLIEIEDSST